MTPIYISYKGFSYALTTQNNNHILGLLGTQGKSFFFSSRATSVAYGGSQVRGLIGPKGTGLWQNHNPGSEPHLQPPPHFMAMPDP